MNFGRKRVLIVGGSTRAAAWSALRAGFQPVCADLFADADTRQMAQIVPVHNYPRSLPEDIMLFESDGWMFTGALENHPDLIQTIADQPTRFGPLLGCAPPALRLVRDPVWIMQTLQSAGHDFLQVRLGNQPPDDGGKWLQKPIHGGGGRLIRVWNREDADHEIGEPFYYQQFATGDSMSATFWRDEERLRFLGATRQLIGSEFAAAPDPFAYCGSVGPIELDAAIEARLIEMAELIANKSGLQGLFGIDFVLNGSTVSIVELNPRYPASVEVLERARGLSILRLYGSWISGSTPVAVEASLDSERKFQLTSPDAQALQPKRIVAKVVIYARNRFEVPDFSEILTQVGLDRTVELADIPVPGTIIERGWPICTVINGGLSNSQTLESARRQVERIQEWLRNCSEGTGVLDRSRTAR